MKALELQLLITEQNACQHNLEMGSGRKEEDPSGRNLRLLP